LRRHTEDREGGYQPRRFAWCTLLLVAAAVRGGWLGTHFADLRDDPDGYYRLAVNLVQTGTYGYRMEGAARIQPTAYRPPLYPVLLVCVGGASRLAPLAIAGLHLVLGVATVAGVFQLGRSWHLGQWSWAAALMTAVDPILLRQSSLVMTETLATALAVAALLALSRLDRKLNVRSAALAGVIIGLAVLCRPTFLVWLAVVVATTCLLPSPRFRRRICLAGGTVLAASLLLSVWFARNLLVLGHPVLATTHGGYTLLLGNNAGFYRYLGTAAWGEVWDSHQLDARYSRVRKELDGNEVLADRWAYAEARRQIRRHPLMFLRASVVRAGRLWGVLPHRIDPEEPVSVRIQRYVVAVWYAGVFLLALVGLARRGRAVVSRPYVWALLLCLAFTAVHLAYWSNLRMRAPLMPAVYLFAAGAVAWRRNRS
jgi:hypothetical protein